MSGTLGSVFDEVATTGDRGPDLRWQVTVPSSAVGDPRGVDVVVPLRLETDDGVVTPRAVNPADEGDRIRIQVPPDVEPPFVLRLRGAGGTREGVPPGDLYLQVEIGGPPATLAGATGALGGTIAGIAVLGLVVALLAYCG